MQDRLVYLRTWYLNIRIYNRNYVNEFMMFVYEFQTKRFIPASRHVGKGEAKPVNRGRTTNLLCLYGMLK